MTEKERTDELSQDELEASGGEQLPDRQVMSVISADPTGTLAGGADDVATAAFTPDSAEGTERPDAAVPPENDAT